MTRPAVLIAHKHLAGVGAMLAADYDVFGLWEGPPVEAAPRVEAMIVAGEFAVDKALAESLPNLKLIACFAVGYDGVDLDWARERGIAVSHAPGVNDADVADHALGLILASRRRIVAGDRELRSGGWTLEAKPLTRGLDGARLGIVGLGRIGMALAKRAEACGMAVSWWGPNAKPGSPYPRSETLAELADEVEVLAVCCKATEENRGLISAEVIDALGPHGLLVNVARGQVVDEDALIAALRDGRLGSAALDVFVEEPTPAERWADVPNTVLTPHGAGATYGAVQAMLALLSQNLEAVLAGRPAVTPVEG